MWRFIIIFCSCFFLWSNLVQAQVVYEQMDEVVIVDVEKQLNHRVLFYRNDRLMASRLLQDTPTSPQFMQWQLLSDGRFRLSWSDFPCDRVIEFDHLGVWKFDCDPVADCGLPWWDQRRLATDLKQP